MAGSYLWKKRDLFYEIALNSVQFYLFLMSALAFSQVGICCTTIALMPYP